MLLKNKSGVDSDEGFPSSKQLSGVAVFLLVYFGLRLIYFVTNIAPFVPPDEVTHYGCSRIFSEVLFFPVYQTGCTCAS